MTNQSLRDLISEKINIRWLQWSQKHPNLARVIDRTRLVESTVDRLRDDPRFIQAMRDADLDDAKLAAAASILDRADQIISATLIL